MVQDYPGDQTGEIKTITKTEGDLANLCQYQFLFLGKVKLLLRNLLERTTEFHGIDPVIKLKGKGLYVP
jgi:hypothetical protein